MRQSSSRLPVVSLNKVLSHFPASVKSAGDVMSIYSPKQWGYVMMNKEKAYSCQCPTVSDVSLAYGPQIASQWISIQVAALFIASASRDEGMADSIKLFSESFAVEVGNFKLTELMLFFSRYRAGRYDGSYTQFDPHRIGYCFFKEFIPERSIELDRIIREEEQRKIEQRRFVAPPGVSSYEAYQEAKRKAAEGDEEAKRLLKGPCS